MKPEVALKIKEEVEKKWNAGFLIVAEYPQWVANIVLIPKKDGKVRICVDYRDLNRASPKDNFPLPHIDLLVDNTAQHSCYSFMDGFSGYNQIQMALKDKEKTTFITAWGIFCYKVMPFELKNAGATYQRAMVYVDDMIAKSKTLEQHITDLHKLFERLRKYRLRLNPAKYTFKSVVTYKDWHDMLPYALHGYRTLVRTSTRATPYSLVYGTEAMLLIEVEIRSLSVLVEAEIDDSEWVQSQLDQFNLIEEKRLTTICHGQLYQRRIKSTFDKRVRPWVFKEEDLVLKRRAHHDKDLQGKWVPNYEGPYIVKHPFSGGALRAKNWNIRSMRVPSRGSTLESLIKENPKNQPPNLQDGEVDVIRYQRKRVDFQMEALDP
ncbi:hypothetical protein CR513_25599, partial [Mucuna pruriens]